MLQQTQFYQGLPAFMYPFYITSDIAGKFGIQKTELEGATVAKIPQSEGIYLNVMSHGT
jgi:hypothetical protein